MKPLYLMALNVGAFVSHCAATEESSHLEHLDTAFNMARDTDVNPINFTHFEHVSSTHEWTPCFVCLSGNQWSLEPIPTANQLPSSIALQTKQAAIIAYEKCVQMQLICDTFSWQTWVANYLDIPDVLSGN